MSSVVCESEQGWPSVGGRPDFLSGLSLYFLRYSEAASADGPCVRDRTGGGKRVKGQSDGSLEMNRHAAERVRSLMRVVLVVCEKTWLG